MAKNTRPGAPRSRTSALNLGRGSFATVDGLNFSLRGLDRLSALPSLSGTSVRTDAAGAETSVMTDEAFLPEDPPVAVPTSWGFSADANRDRKQRESDAALADEKEDPEGPIEEPEAGSEKRSVDVLRESVGAIESSRETGSPAGVERTLSDLFENAFGETDAESLPTEAEEAGGEMSGLARSAFLAHVSAIRYGEFGQVAERFESAALLARRWLPEARARAAVENLESLAALREEEASRYAEESLRAVRSDGAVSGEQRDRLLSNISFWSVHSADRSRWDELSRELADSAVPENTLDAAELEGGGARVAGGQRGFGWNQFLAGVAFLWAWARRFIDSFWSHGAPVRMDFTPRQGEWGRTDASNSSVLAEGRGRREYFDDATEYRLIAAVGRAKRDENRGLRIKTNVTRPAQAHIREAVRRFLRALDENYAFLRMMGAKGEDLTASDGLEMLGIVERMAGHYDSFYKNPELVPEKPRSSFKTNRDLGDFYAGLLSTLRGRLESLIDEGGELTEEDRRALTSLDPGDHSLHRYVRYMHQGAIDFFTEKGVRFGESTGQVHVEAGVPEKDGRSRTIDIINVAEGPLIEDSRVRSPALEVLGNAFGHDGNHNGYHLLVGDTVLSGHIALGDHAMDIFGDFRDPDEGGMVRVRYFEKIGPPVGRRGRVFYLARVLQGLGFAVTEKGGYLEAVIDKDQNTMQVGEMMETAARALEIVSNSLNLDVTFGPLMGPNENRNLEMFDEWAKMALAEGRLPGTPIREAHTLMPRWQERGEAREELRGRLNAELARLEMPPIPEHVPIGQRTIDMYFNTPVEQGLVSGELRRGRRGRLRRTRNFDPVGAMARSLGEDPASMARMAGFIEGLDPAPFEFEPIGTVGGLIVEQGRRELDSGVWVNVIVARDPATGAVGYATAELARMRGGRLQLDTDTLSRKLTEQGIAVPAEPEERPSGVENYFQSRLAERPDEHGAWGEHAGLSISAGNGQARILPVTYDKDQTRSGGVVWATPRTTPEDIEAIVALRAGGGLLGTSPAVNTHMGVTTREFKVPAVSLPRAQWTSDGRMRIEAPVYGDARRDGNGLWVRDAVARQSLVLEEGDLIRLDPASGGVRLYDSPEQNVRALAGRAAELYVRERDFGALAAWLEEADPQARALLATALIESLLEHVPRHPELSYEITALRGRIAASGQQAREALGAHGAATVAREQALVEEALAEVTEMVNAARRVDDVNVVMERARERVARFVTVAGALGRSSTRAERALEEVEGAAQRRREDIWESEESEVEALGDFEVTSDNAVALKSVMRRAGQRTETSALPLTLQERASGWARDLESWLEGRRGFFNGRMTVGLNELRAVDQAGGGKGAVLGEIERVVEAAGEDTARGIGVTREAYRRFLTEAGIADEVDRLAGLAPGAMPPAERAAAIGELIRGAVLSPDSGIGREIIEAVRAAGLGGAVAVRSSAGNEDGDESAMAGAGNSHPHVINDPAAVLAQVQDVWASLYNERALVYRSERGLPLSDDQAVVIQEFIDADVSGVAFTRDPVTGHPGRMVVNSALGQNEAVVLNRVSPDRFTLDWAGGGEVSPAVIADKRRRMGPREGGGLEDEAVPEHLRRSRSLSAAQLERVRRVARALEEHFGYALDIEFSFVGDRLYILQARPATR